MLYGPRELGTVPPHFPVTPFSCRYRKDTGTDRNRQSTYEMNYPIHIPMKPLLVATFLVPNLITAAVLSGKIQDSRRTPLDGVVVTAWDAGTGKGLRSTSAARNFSISGLEEGNYLLKAEKTGMALLLGAVQIRADSSYELNLVLADNSGDASLVKALPSLRPPVQPPSPPPTPNRFRQSKLIHKVAAAYPASAKQAGISGTVDIATVMRVDGTLDDLVVLSAPTSDLALAALVAVRQWRYTPTLLDGRALEVEFTVHVNFAPR
jgi:TonB family protein